MAVFSLFVTLRTGVGRGIFYTHQAGRAERERNVGQAHQIVEGDVEVFRQPDFDRVVGRVGIALIGRYGVHPQKHQCGQLPLCQAPARAEGITHYLQRQDWSMLDSKRISAIAVACKAAR